jgi:VRR-NUC domain
VSRSVFRMTEDDLQDSILRLARRLGYLAFHPYDSRKSAPGYPDLTLVHTRSGALIFAELKSSEGRVTAEQRTWLAALDAPGRLAVVWRPIDWTSGHIPELLQQHAKARP